MKERNAAWLKMSGLSGILAPIITFACVLLAIGSYPQFSWTNNALSDLGVVPGITAILFNSGLISSGLLVIAFSWGLPLLLRRKILGRAAASVLILAGLALALIGVFTEQYGRIHWYVSVMFFMLFPIAMLLVFVTFLSTAELKMSLLTLLMAVLAGAVWTIRFGEGVAIPETLAAFGASIWSVVLGLRMLKTSSRPSK